MPLDEDTFGGINLGNLGGLLGGAAATAASGAASAAGIDPSVVQAASQVASSPIAKAGFQAGLAAASGNTAPHTDPAVQAAKAALPAAAKAGFDAGASLAAGHAKTGGAALPGTPVEQAMHLMLHGSPSQKGWVHIGIAAAAAGTLAVLTGVALPAVVGIAAISAGAVYFLDPQK